MESKPQIRRGTLLQTEDFHLEYEKFEGNLFLHFETSNWSIDTYKLYLRLWKIVLKELQTKGYNDVYCIVPYDDKVIKFEQMFGFNSIADLDKGVLMQRSTTWV